MMKVCEKISGTFRSGEQGPNFCNIRSIILPAHKQSGTIRGTLTALNESSEALS